MYKMIRYNFPIINTINDVLPHIEGYTEFIVAEREFGTVINYKVIAPGTFDMVDRDDIGGAIRRECRGIIFDVDGKIMSRPFHKFFNVNERAETQADTIDLTESHTVMEKEDGSMIRPLWFNDQLYFGTKMGVTDVSKQAQNWFEGRIASPAEVDMYIKGYSVPGIYLEQYDWLMEKMGAGITPLFEWTSPQNQIVLEYKKADLILLGMRDNVTGVYLPMDEDAPFTQVRRYGSSDVDMPTFIEEARKKSDREGDIIQFSDGHMLKSKNDWYVTIHKTIERVAFDRHIVALVLESEVDDVYPTLPATTQERVRAFEGDFFKAHKTKINDLSELVEAAKTKYDGSKKRIALEMVPTLKHKRDASIIFRAIDGHDIYDLVDMIIKNSLNTNTKWDECAKWMGMG